MTKDRPNVEDAARKIYGLPPEWRWFKWEAVGDHPNYFGTNVTGAIPGGVVTRGPRKGKPNWRLPRQMEMTVTVSDAQLDQFYAEWESETGRCHVCGGDGEAVAGWSSADGVRTRKCARCDGTGKSA